MSLIYNNFYDAPNPLCLAPWNSLTVHPDGRVSPDMHYQGEYGNLYESTLADMWHSEQAHQLRTDMKARHYNPACATCQKKDKLVGKSRRHYFWDIFPHDLKSREVDPLAEPDIVYLDFTTSNVCNLKCVHCSGEVSTAWLKDEKKLAHRPFRSKTAPWGRLDPKCIDNLFVHPSHFRNLRFVALRGGEPLYERINLSILEKFVLEGTAKDITLDISTNAAVLDPEFLELFKHFKEIQLYISIEGAGEMYSILRGGHFKASDLEDNMKTFLDIPNLRICFAITTMSANVMRLLDVWRWLKPYLDYGVEFSFSNTVVSPRYLDIDVLPDDVKADALVKAKMIPQTLEYREGGEYNTGIHNVIKSLTTRKFDEEERLKRFKHFLKYMGDLDRIRDTRYFELVPELKKWHEKYYDHPEL